MTRERDAFHRIRENARNSVQYTQDYNAPSSTKIKTNYLSAVVWTSVVAAVVCTIFMGLLLYVVNESHIEERLEKAATHAIYNLENVIREQNEQIQQLKAENKKIYNYIKFWSPMEHRLPAGVKEKWKLKGYGIPKYELQFHNTCQEGNLCLPFLE